MLRRNTSVHLIAEKSRTRLKYKARNKLPSGSAVSGSGNYGASGGRRPLRTFGLHEVSCFCVMRTSSYCQGEAARL